MLVRLLRAAGRWREAEEQFQRAQRRLEEFKVVCSGALRQAAQLPLQAELRSRANDRIVLRPERSGCVRAPPCTRCSFARRRMVSGSHMPASAMAPCGVGGALAQSSGLQLESPIWRHWTEEFASDHSFVHYDERGNGLSDWDNPTFSVDAFVRDLEAVVDALASIGSR